MSIRTRSFNRGAGKLKIRETSLKPSQHLSSPIFAYIYSLSMEKVGCLVPMNPHPPQVVTQQIEQWVTRQEAQRVWYPICLFRIIKIIRLIAFPEFPDRLRTLVIRPRPNPERDAVECMRRVLLQHKCMVDAVRLCSSGADLNVVRKAGLSSPSLASVISSAPCI